MASSGRAAACIYLAVFLDLVGGFMVMPLLPFVMIEMGATPFEISFISACFSFAQIVGTTLLGMLSDCIGRRRVVIMCLLASSASLAAFGMSTAVWQLLLFRGLAGFFSGTIGICEAFLGDIVAEGERAGALAKVGAIFGLGMIAGPGIGGVLAPIGFSGVCFVGAAVTAVNSMLGAVLLPPDVICHESTKAIVDESDEVASLMTLLKLMGRETDIATLYAINLLQAVAVGILLGIMALFFYDNYGTTGSGMSHILCVSGLCAVAFQVFVVGRVISALGEKWSMVLGNLFRGVGYTLLNMIHNDWIPTIVVSAIVCGGGLVCAPLVSALTAVTPQHVRGLTLGVFNSIGSSGTFLGPLLAGKLYETNTLAPFWVSAACSAAGALLAVYPLKATIAVSGQQPLEPPLMSAEAPAAPKLLRSTSSNLQLIHTEAGSLCQPLVLTSPQNAGHEPFLSPRKPRRQMSVDLLR